MQCSDETKVNFTAADSCIVQERHLESLEKIHNLYKMCSLFAALPLN